MTWSFIPQHLLVKMNQILEDLRTHDLETYNHCVRVSQLCRFLAEAAQLSAYEIIQAQFAGLLHDIGKMKIPLEVLNKPGKLNDQEYELVKKHSLFSAELLEPLESSEFFRDIQLSVLHHHERIDGKGYPLELKGEEIPYAARLILIADTVDAMTQTRSYRKGLPLEVVYQELEKFAGTQFDKELVEVFISAHKKALQKPPVSSVVCLPRKQQAA